MPTMKQLALQWIQLLPDDCTFDDIRYHLYVREKVEAGLQDADEGRVIPHAEVKRRMSEWLVPYGQI